MTATRYRKAAWDRRVKNWSANCVSAKACKRMTPELPPDETNSPAPVPKRARFAVVTIRLDGEARTFRVSRWDESRLFALGKAQAASTIGKRVALVLENLL